MTNMNFKLSNVFEQKRKNQIVCFVVVVVVVVVFSCFFFVVVFFFFMSLTFRTIIEIPLYAST